MTKRSHYIKFITIGLLSIAIAVLVISNLTQNSYIITIEIQSSKKGNLQIFYSSNNNFSEENSLKHFINTVGTFDLVSFSIPKNSISNLRIDPVSNFKIKSISFSNYKQTSIIKGQILLDNIIPLHHIDSLYLENNQVIGITSGSDPYFSFKKLPILNKAKSITINQIVLFLLVFSIIFLLLYILWEYWLKYDYIKSPLSNQSVEPSPLIFQMLLVIVFLWYLYQTLFFATNIKQGIAPDEIYHVLLSKFQSKSFSLYNHDTPDSYFLGAISVRPYLYHFLMGKLLMLNIWSIKDFVFLRYLNIILGLFTLYFTLLLAKEVTKNKWIQIAVLVIQSNILMFVFLNSMVSYDNLINLISTVSFLILIRFVKKYERKDLLLLFILMELGVLTKITYGPIVVIQIIILFFYSRLIYINRTKLLSRCCTGRDIFLISVLTLLFALNLHLYVNNLIYYGQIQPKTEKVFGHEKAYNNYEIYKRNYDLQTTVNEKSLMEFPKFLPKYLRRTVDTIFGICAHNNLTRSNISLLLYGFLGLLSLFIYFIKFNNNQFIKLILFSIIVYTAVILYVNYSLYKLMGSFGLALQGRYNFPVLSLVNVFVAYNLFFHFRDRTKIVLLFLFAFIFTYNSFFWSISKFTTDWFMN